jgi:hypothetical protein
MFCIKNFEHFLNSDFSRNKKKEWSLEDKSRIYEMLIFKLNCGISYHVDLLQHNYSFFMSWFNINFISETREIKSRIAMEKASFNKKTLFHKQIRLKFK